MNETILQVNSISKRYKKFTLKDVSFSIPKGYIMGFVGRNGAGKSTIIRSIMNLIQFDGGSIEVFGLDNRKHSMEIRKRIGYVSEEQFFYYTLTIEQIGKLVSNFYSNWDNHYFFSLLDRFNIDKRKKIMKLSKGTKMIFALILALSHHPELLVLDEPTSGLDPVIRNEILELFLSIIQSEERTIFFSSHITSDIEKVADYLTIIEDGRIIISDEKNHLFDIWRVIKAENSFLDDEVNKRLTGVRHNEFGFSAITDQWQECEKEFKRKLPSGQFKIEPISLESFLIHISCDQKNGGNHHV